MGPTQIPPEIFDDYLSDLKERYTAGNYHLLEFNCNSFTQDVSRWTSRPGRQRRKYEELMRWDGNGDRS